MQTSRCSVEIWECSATQILREIIFFPNCNFLATLILKGRKLPILEALKFDFWKFHT